MKENLNPVLASDPSRTRARRRPPRRLALALALAVAAVLLTCSTAGAYGIVAFSGAATAPGGGALHQAGAHPDLTTTIELPVTTDSRGDAVPDGNLKDIVVDLPAGLVGNPTAAATCTPAQLNGPNKFAVCPVESQVGVVTLYGTMFGRTPTSFGVQGVYNVEPPPGVPARFAFNTSGVLTYIDARVRSGGDYGLSVDIADVSRSLPVMRTSLTLWGVPADPVHDAERVDTRTSVPGIASAAPRLPFLTNPTRCATTPLTTSMRTASWQQPGVFHAASFDHDALGEAMTVDGCELLAFAPQIAVAPVSRQAGAPTGLQVDVTVPQDDNPDGLATAHLRDAVVTLPAGMAVSPSAADGLTSCTPAQIALDSDAAPSCPDASKLGTVRIDTPLLADPMTGSIHLAAQSDNPFGSLLAIYLVAEGDGVTIKLAGRIAPDPVTGQLTTTFERTPQLPFSKLSLRFDGGPRAALSNPRTCGVKTATAQLTGWNGAVVTDDSSFAIETGIDGAPCDAAAFAPTFTAGTTSNAAGGDSPFLLRFGRSDADQELGTIAVDMPAGLLGRIASVPLCDEAQMAAGTCGEASRVGSATTLTGPGATPFALGGGRVYLGGPYKGAPFSLSIVVPAKAGPLDLGTVVVRAAIHVDRRTTALRIVSDPLPTILQGIPLGIRSVEIAIDRPGFMFNPTSCAPKRVGARIASASGAGADVGARFQAAGCAALPFRPRLSLRVGARGRTRGGKTTPLRATVVMPRSQANLRVVDVTLPRTLNSRLAVVNNRNACTPEQYEARRCPQQVGTAVAVTPVLREPLRGPIYFVRNPARKLPDLVVALDGQVAVDLVGRVSIDRRQRLRTSFDTVPDVPISRFTLDLVAGRNGAIGVVGNLCRPAARAQRSMLGFTAQSGRRLAREQRLTVAGCGRPARRARR